MTRDKMTNKINWISVNIDNFEYRRIITVKIQKQKKFKIFVEYFLFCILNQQKNSQKSRLTLIHIS